METRNNAGAGVATHGHAAAELRDFIARAGNSPMLKLSPYARLPVLLDAYMRETESALAILSAVMLRKHFGVGEVTPAQYMALAELANMTPPSCAHANGCLCDACLPRPPL